MSRDASRTWAIPTFAIPLAHLFWPESPQDILATLDQRRTNLAEVPFWGSRFGLTVFELLWIGGLVVEVNLEKLRLLLSPWFEQ